jgi:hypothetical protein
VANTLKLYGDGAVGFINWLDGFTALNRYGLGRGCGVNAGVA